ncbi:MAG: bifunctional demethylmenaquinone methyltransferase/2-methoxy-6-polyprenyl-1,4-benzoquinol methylase UbiE [Candidatus Omnitrophota bacterium]
MDNLPYSKSESWKMFDKISGRYDLLNRLLSFGLDIGWRKKIVSFLPPKNDLTILDLATGTGDVLLYLFEQTKSIKIAYGIDLSEKMLLIGQEKIKTRKLEAQIILKNGDINQIPFEENYFDAATIAFGIRNVVNPKQVLSEMLRVLKPGGRAIILEFAIPENALVRPIFTFYLRKILPAVGALISGNLKAYKYLNQTVETFMYGEEFCQAMGACGFLNVRAHPLTFQTAMIYTGEKP